MPTPPPLDDPLERATERHRAGDLAAARDLYARALAGDPGRAAALFGLGVLELQGGLANVALDLLRRAAAASPGEFRYAFGLGQALAASGQWHDAAASCRRAIELNPRSGDAQFALGVALQASGDLPGATAAFAAAVELQPDIAEAHNNLGNCRRLAGDIAGAERAYRGALAARPGDAGAMTNLGTTLLATGRAAEGIQLLRSAAAAAPDAATPLVNLGMALCELRDFAEGADHLRRACELDTTSSEAHYNLGNALVGLGKTRDAADAYRRAASLARDPFDALNNLGTVLKQLGEFKPALDAYDAAIRARPTSPVAFNNAGCLLRAFGRMEEAERVLRRGLEVAADHPALHENLASVLKDSGDLDGAIASFRRAVELDPTAAATHGSLAYSLTFRCAEPAPILAECVGWGERHAAAFRKEVRPHDNERNPDRRIRVGYVSPAFRDHCQALFLVPLLSNHDRAAIEVFCYSDAERRDAVTERLAGYANLWRDVRPLSDAALAEQIRADGIDVLVDLTMHMADGRPLVFARKPAPAQMAWLAYPGTTGIAGMDYRLSDPRLDPPGYDAHYTERTIRLADTFWCYDPLSEDLDVGTLPALRNGFVTFGCLNNPCKLTDVTLDLWGGVLRALPSSRLTLLAPPGPARRRLSETLATRGVAGERITFLPYQPRPAYLAAYNDIDLGLDTFPYNGHTTSLDSYWMGVPVVTRVGRTCVGRAGLSQLFNLDLLPLAADTDEAFLRTATDLATDLPRLAELRRTLRQRLARSPLMDGSRFARSIESAYRHAWNAYCATA
jgi:predicted O-linked N-acetylglucosamine transferase (SPINDLY family)